MKRSLTLLVLGGLVVGAFADAGQAAGDKAKRRTDAAARFARRDKNGDGVLTLAEVGKKDAAKAAARFKRLDKDGDGKLTPAEARIKAKPKA